MISEEHDSVDSVSTCMTITRAGVLGRPKSYLMSNMRLLTPEECDIMMTLKLITQQHTGSCCEDKGLASVCFRCSLNQKTLKRKGAHMKGPSCWESTELRRYVSSKRLSHFKSRDIFPKTPLTLMRRCYLSLQVAVCVCVTLSILSVCWPCLSGISGKVSVSFLHCCWIMRCD